MEDKEYMDADFEVISMVNRGPGPGGKLPSKVIHFVPEERAETVLALDARIQKVRKAIPVILFSLAVLLAFIAGRAL